MFNRFLALFLLGTVVWGLVQWVRHWRLSYLATAGTSVFLFGMLVTRHPIMYFGAGALMLLRWSLIARERRLGGAEPDLFGFPKLGLRPSELTNPLGRELEPARMPGESTEKMRERQLDAVRVSRNQGDGLVARMTAYRALQELDIDELRPVFRLVMGRNRAQRQLAAELIVTKGDDAAIDALREASRRHADLTGQFQSALCARGSEALAAEKELYFTEQNRAIRHRALMALVSRACNAQAGSHAAKAGFDRVLLALAAETDREILLELVKQLLERGRLDALTAEFDKLPTQRREVIIERFPEAGLPQPAQQVTDLYRVALRDADPSVAAAARYIVGGAGFEPLKAEFEQPATALEGWNQLTLKSAPAVIPCAGGGWLKIEPGDLNLRARFEHLRASEVDNVQVQLVLTDSQGREWGLVSYFQAAIFTDDFDNDDRRVALEQENAFSFWNDVPEAWQNALQERCLVAGVANLLDGRSSFDLRIGTQTLVLKMKYQGPKIDIALLGSELVVRVSDLCHLLVKSEAEAGEFGGSAPIPPFAWLVPADRLLCFAEPRCHYAELADMDEVEPGAGKPSEAKRLESTGDAQPGVVFERG